MTLKQIQNTKKLTTEYHAFVSDSAAGRLSHLLPKMAHEISRSDKIHLKTLYLDRD
jgi:hypothetical protein